MVNDQEEDQEELGWMMYDIVCQWMGTNNYTEIKRMAEDRQIWRWMTHQPSE